MTPVFEGLLPVFLLIFLGVAVKRLNLMPEASWSGMNRLGFYLLMPVLLFSIFYKADFARLSAGTLGIALLIGIMIVLPLGFVMRQKLQYWLDLDGPSYSSLYQSVGRWNGFIALAVVEKIYGAQGLEIVAIALIVLIIPINIFNIGIVTMLADAKTADRQSLWRRMLTNPLVIAAMLGLLFNVISLPIYGPVMSTFDLLAQATLPIGLLLIGVGLKFEFSSGDLRATLFGAFGKLIIIPAVYVLLAYMLGISGDTLMVVALCGAVPTAMSGYIMASQMGGNAPLLATMVTAQTLISFFSIPLVLALTALLAY